MNLVEQLQAEAIDQNVPLSTLLRKAKLIASKLNLQEAVRWVDAELKGYGKNIEEYPEYRHVQGQVMAYSPWQGWRPPAGESRIIQALSNRQVADSVSALEDLLAQGKSGTLTLEIDHQVQAAILKGNPGWTEMHTEIQRAALVAILDHVRTLVLNWALELEEKGVTGEGVRFSETEKARARSASISIENFHGNFHAGDIGGVQNRVNQGSSDSSTNVQDAASVFASIEQAAEGLDDETRQAIRELVDELRLSEGKPSKFLAAYSKIVAFAADHSALLPVLPALASLLPS